MGRAGYIAAPVAADASDGRALLENLESNPICNLRFDDDIPCVYVTRKRYATSAQLYFIHEVIIEKLKSQRTSKILGDDSALSTVHSDDRNWIVNNWMPRAITTGLQVDR